MQTEHDGYSLQIDTMICKYWASYSEPVIELPYGNLFAVRQGIRVAAYWNQQACEK